MNEDNTVSVTISRETNLRELRESKQAKTKAQVPAGLRSREAK